MPAWAFRGASFNDSKMSSPERKRESGSSEALPEERTKFDARNKFLLTPSMRQKRTAALAKLQSLEKESTSNLDILPSECILQILHHFELPKQSRRPHDNPSTSSLWSFLNSTNRAKQLWLSNTTSILVGMQEKQYPEFLTLFGRVGRETEGQFSNLQCAVDTQHGRGMLEDADYYMHTSESYRNRNPKAYKFHVVRILGRIARCIDEQFDVFRKANFDNVDWCLQFSEATMKRALVTLWRMGWEDPNHSRWQASGTEMDATLKAAKLAKFFSQETEEVQSCIRELLFVVGKLTEQQFDLENQAKLWLDDYFERRAVDTDEERLEVIQWAWNAINATVLAGTIIYGIDEAVKGSMTSQDRTDFDIFIEARLGELYDLKIASKDDEDRGPAFRELEDHLQLREAMNLGDIVPRSATEEFELRRNYGLP